MNLELYTSITALFVSIMGPIISYYKLRTSQKTWEQEQKINLEKELAFLRLKKRYATYGKVFEILGKVRDIEYPPHHYRELEENKNDLKEYADELLSLLYQSPGMIMEYKTRSMLLKVYQSVYRFCDDEIELSQLVDVFYNARRELRMDLEFDDYKASKKLKDILKSKEEEEQQRKKELENKFWIKKGILARWTRPGYPSQAVTCSKVREVINFWKRRRIKTVICLLSNEELKKYYKQCEREEKKDLLEIYKESGIKVYHIPVKDFQNPPLNKNELEKVLHWYEKSEKPVLIHCGAGEDRTGIAIDYINQYFS